MNVLMVCDNDETLIRMRVYLSLPKPIWGSIILDVLCGRAEDLP